MGGKLIVWIFAMRILMILTSLVSYFVNDAVSKSLFDGKKEFNFEHPLTNLVWITSIISIVVTFIASYVLLGDLPDVDGVDPSGWRFRSSSAAGPSPAP